MTTYAGISLVSLLTFSIHSTVIFAAEEENAATPAVPDRQIQQLLEEQEKLRRKLKPKDQDLIADLKKENRRLRDEIEKKTPVWEREISAGASLTRGNSDTMRINAGVKAKYNKGKNKLELNATGDYGESEDVKNIEKARGQGQYDYCFSRRFYWLLNMSADHDDMAKLDYRLIVSPGIGCKILSTATVKLDVTVGPAYVVEQFRRPTESAVSRRDASSDSVSWRVSETLEYKISNSSKVTQKLSVLSDISDMNDTILRGEIGAESELTRKLSLRIILKDDFVNEPAAGAGRNDLYLTGSLVWKF